MSFPDGESRHGAIVRPTPTPVDLVYHMSVVNAANAENQLLKAENANLREENLALQLKLAEALDNAALWHGKFFSLADSESTFKLANDDGEQSQEKAARERAERQRLTSRLLALYGERPNDEVAIGAAKNADGVVVNVVAEFDRLVFAFPRLTNDGEFIQVFSPGYNYRLEFPTEPRLDAVTLILESCPGEVQIKSEEEFDEFCERSWKYVTKTRIQQGRVS
jgi:hypothetical protein